MRAAQSQASNLANNASSTAAGYGTGAEDVNATLFPFLNREINSPEGISQQDQTAMLSEGLGGAGGGASGIMSKLNQRAAATGNASGFGAEADQAAREGEKSAAQQSSSVASKNAETKLNQQQEGAKGLSSLYGTDVGAQLKGLGIQNDAIGQEVNAGSHGWLQNLTSLIAAVRGGGQAPGGLPTMGGAAPGADDMSDFDELAAGA